MDEEHTQPYAEITVEEIADGPFDPDEPLEVRAREIIERADHLQRRAQAVKRASDGWDVVKTDDDWTQLVARADEDYASGRFLIEQLGAERYLDPALMSTLLRLREGLIADIGVTNTHELMLIDLAVISYYNVLRLNMCVGDLMLFIEHEFFAREGPTLRAERKGWVVRGLTVEERVERLRWQFMPMIERAHRMFLQNIKAILQFRSVHGGAAASPQQGVSPSNGDVSDAAPAPRRTRRKALGRRRRRAANERSNQVEAVDGAGSARAS